MRHDSIERELVRLLVQGLGAREIARRIKLPEEEVHSAVLRAFRNLKNEGEPQLKRQSKVPPL